jgi:penicillin-binding protein 1A
MLRILAALFGVLSIAAVLGVAAVIYVFQHFSEGLPDYTQLADYQPPVMTRVYAGDGRLLAEYAVEKRVFVPIEVIPEPLIDAFLSAEDQHFYSHAGIDVLGIIRAAVTNITNLGTDRRLVGASTITQQVAKNFLLTNEVSLDRKIKEAILAYRMEQAFSKKRILELYLNEIYLGYGSYGVVSAALNYFNKSLDELTVAEMAFLAALPKAPNNYDPVRHPAAAEGRRNWVIGRMLEDGRITEEQAEEARAAPLTLHRRATSDVVRADYFAEEIRRELVGRFGEDALYKGGMVVRSTVDSRLQTIADRILRQGLETYDRRHGWRGPIASVVSAEDKGKGVPADWRDRLSQAPTPPGMGDWRLAVVLGLDREAADIGFVDGLLGIIPLAELKWARPWLEGQKVGAAVKKPSDVLAPGDIIAVEPVQENDKGEAYPEGTFGLRQLPEIEGALVALDPHTGRVLAISGGYSAERSQFNRATQALRQPGSAFKPFVYLAGLEAGYTPTTLILDAPFVIEQGPGLPQWRPSNYSNKFYGLSTMRLGIEKSRNLMTVRLAQALGMEKVVDVAKRFGVVDDMPPLLSYALGSGETTLLRLTTAYAMLVNGGKRITPTLIDRIQDRHGLTTFRHDVRDCTECQAAQWRAQAVPEILDTREQVTDPADAYQVVSMLEGVVRRGTGVRIRAVGKPLAGKTGTTNDSRDTWFVGFSPDLAVGVFVGFDEPTPLGNKETGSSVAVPIFRDFMIEALESKPAVPFRIPPGIRLVRIEAASGRLARPGDDKVILEAFKPGTVPTADAEIPAGVSATITGPATGTGGLY